MQPVLTDKQSINCVFAIHQHKIRFLMISGEVTRIPNTLYADMGSVREVIVINVMLVSTLSALRQKEIKILTCAASLQ